MKVVTPEEMRDSERITIDELGIPGIVLMERAALAVCAELPGEGSVLVLCGPGNNGGDGYAIARMLHIAGRECAVWSIGRETLKGDALTNALAAENCGVPLYQGMDSLEELLPQYPIQVDALLGTGLARPLSGAFHEAVELLNRQGEYVLAVDIPSGVNGADGSVMGIAVKADKTVTFQLPKRGHLLYPGREYAGVLTVADIGIPRYLYENIQTELTCSEDISLWRRKANSHKGTYGHVAVVAGSAGMEGAGSLCSRAALRMGAGLVSWAVPGMADPVERMAEVMTQRIGLDRYFIPLYMPEVLRFLKGKTVMALGPGLGRAEGTEAFVRQLLENTQLPVVLDADGLWALGQDVESLGENRTVVLTPHPGEMAHLCGVSLEEILRSPVDYAQELAEKSGATVLLKGSTTVVAGRDGLHFNTTGNPGMATGGSGDVLCGMVASLIAQGMEGSHAAWTAAYLHGRAGDRARQALGEMYMAAGDIIGHLPEVLRQYEGLTDGIPQRLSPDKP